MEEAVRKRRKEGERIGEEEESTAPRKMDQEFTEEIIEMFLKVANKLRKTVADDTRTTKPVKASMNYDIDTMQSLIIKLKNAMISEERKNAGLQSAIKTLKEEIRCTPTYASVARDSLHVQAYAPKRHVLFVQSNNREKTSKDIKEEVIKKVNPKIDKIKIKNMRQTKANSIVMEFDTRSDLQKFKDYSKLETLQIEEPKKKNPLLILYDVDSLLTVNELKENIVQQNLEGEFPVEESDIIPRFKTGPRNKPTVHWVIQVTPKIKKYILKQGSRLYTRFFSLKVRDILQMARCLKCHDLGHVVKHCSNEERCGRCGATDHKKPDCKSEKQICISCNKRKLKCTTKREDCPSHKTFYQKLQENIDYGD